NLHEFPYFSSIGRSPNREGELGLNRHRDIPAQLPTATLRAVHGKQRACRSFHPKGTPLGAATSRLRGGLLPQLRNMYVCSMDTPHLVPILIHLSGHVRPRNCNTPHSKGRLLSVAIAAPPVSHCLRHAYKLCDPRELCALSTIEGSQCTH